MRAAGREASRRKRQKHSEAFEALKKSNEETTKALVETRKSLKRSNAAVKELFDRRCGDISGLSPGVRATCLFLSSSSVPGNSSHSSDQGNSSSLPSDQGNSS